LWSGELVLLFMMLCQSACFRGQVRSLQKN
jgi:hypothetical protein